MLQLHLSLDHMTLLMPVLIFELIRQIPLELTKAGHPTQCKKVAFPGDFSGAKQYCHLLHNFP